MTPEQEAALQALADEWITAEEGRGPTALARGLLDALDDLRDERARWQPVLDAWAAYEARPCHATEGGLQRALRKAVSNG